MLVSFGFRVNLCISHGRAHKSTPGPQYLHGFRVVLCYSHTIYYTECTCGICGTCGISHYVCFHECGIRGTYNHARLAIICVFTIAGLAGSSLRVFSRARDPRDVQSYAFSQLRDRTPFGAIKLYKQKGWGRLALTT